MSCMAALMANVNAHVLPDAAIRIMFTLVWFGVCIAAVVQVWIWISSWVKKIWKEFWQDLTQDEARKELERYL